jgi:hypothetical protein
MLRVIVVVFCGDNLFGGGPVFYPQFERLQKVMARIDDGAITGAVSE